MQTQANTPVAIPAPLHPTNAGIQYNTPDKMHYSQMNVTRFSRVACTGNETMQYEAEQHQVNVLRETTVPAPLFIRSCLSPGGASTLLPQFKLLRYEILIQSKIGQNRTN